MNPLPIQRASQLSSTGPQTQWLIEGLWSDQAVGILRSSNQQNAARQFVQFLLGPRGREILGRYGYDLPSTVP